MTGRLITLASGMLLIGFIGAAGMSETAEPAAPFLFTPLDERGVTFTRDGNAAYFAIRVGEGAMQVLCVSERHDGKWSEPKILPFSGRHVDADPFITPDGGTLYFASNRTQDDDEKQDLDIWVVLKKGGGWGEPHPVSGNVNSPSSNERSPVLTQSRRLYFVSTRKGAGDIFYAERGQDGTFGEPVPLGPEVNSSSPEIQVAISPDEQTLVFAAFRPDEVLAPGLPYSRGDLYVSHLENGSWTQARRLGGEINTVAAEQSPSFSADGKYLYFMSERGFAMNQDILLTYDTLERGLHSALNNRGNVYRIPATALRDTQ